MATLREWLRRLWGTLRRNSRDREMEEELRSHLELASADVPQRGESAEDGLRAARLRFGGTTQAMEAMRDQRGLPWLDDLARDVSYGLRTLRRAPVFTAVSVLTLALGIGANTAIFSIVNGVILRPLGYPKPEQLMSLTSEFAALGFTRNAVSASEYVEFRKINQSFAEVGAYTSGGGGYTTSEVNLTADDRPLRVRSVSVDAHLFKALGVQPAQGRFFSEEETAAWTGTLPPPIAILSHELWQTAFGGQPLLGQTVEIEGHVPVLLFALGMSMATGVLFGLAPVVAGRVNGLVTALREGGSRGATGVGRIRRALVMAEVALAVMLVIGAGLLIRTVYNLTRVDAGFDRSHLVTFSMTLPQATSEADTRAQAYQRLLDKFRVAPGVQGATVMSGLPPNRSPESIITRIENYTSSDGRPGEVIEYYQFVMGDYFQTMGVPIVAGRGFERTDIASKGKVVVINETLANRIWKGQNPIGQRLRPNLSAIGGGNPWHTVIGVARDVKQGGVENSTGTEIYVSLDQHAIAPPTMNVVLRTTLPPAALSGTIERMVHEVDPTVPIVRLRDMDSVFAESIRRPRLLAVLLGAFAGLALLLAAVGTYGVLSYMVAARRRELGIRIALGAGRSGVFALVMKQGLQLTIIGVVVGVAGALGLNRLIASLLFGVQPTDGTTLVVVIATIALVAATACWLPAWRASRLDPSVMLRHE